MTETKVTTTIQRAETKVTEKERNKMTINELIKYEIEESGMPIKFVSDKTGIPYRTLYKAVNRKTGIKAEMAVTLCLFLNIELERLVECEDVVSA